MPNYDMPLYRPPSEGENLIIQVTLGCSFNRCRFCSMYREKRFQIRPLDRVFADIDQAVSTWPEARRVFLADGDALVLPSDHLLPILQYLDRRLPNLNRVSCYALPANLLKKNISELTALRQHKLSLIYYGIESGSPEILKRITKGATPGGMVEGLLKAREAGIKVSATVVLGLGGQPLWREHVEGTVALLHQAPVTYLSTLQLVLDPALEATFRAAFAPPFALQDDAGMLAEQHLLIASLTQPPQRIIFRSNHASNALALAGTLPGDREKLLEQIEAAQRHGTALRPWWLRGL